MSSEGPMCSLLPCFGTSKLLGTVFCISTSTLVHRVHVRTWGKQGGEKLLFYPSFIHSVNSLFRFFRKQLSSTSFLSVLSDYMANCRLQFALHLQYQTQKWQILLLLLPPKSPFLLTRFPLLKLGKRPYHKIESMNDAKKF